MEQEDRIRQLLEEIRDTQREHLAEYKKAAARALELQQHAVARQEKIGGLYRKVVALGGVMVAVLLALLAYLLVKWGARIF